MFKSKNPVIHLVFIATIAISCAKKETPHSELPPPPRTEPQSTESQSHEGPSWTMNIHTQCETLSIDNCVAGYGFSVQANGTFNVGPGPQGQKLVGHIKEEQVKELSDLVHPFLSESQLDCRQAVFNQTLDTVSFAFKQQSSVILKSSHQEFCNASTLSPESAKAVFNFIKKLSVEYYPIPFPHDTCEDSVKLLETLYSSLRPCTQDEDCLYFEQNLEEIPRDEYTFLATNECSPVKPLIVANLKEVQSRKQELLNLLELTNRSCKSIYTSLNCNGFSAFQPTQPAPICTAGQCKMRSMN